MLSLALAYAMMSLSVPVAATDPTVFVAVSAEKASGFETLAECEEALGGPDEQLGNARADQQTSPRGSRFNRTAGNISRCEVVEGEPLIVVYPKGHEALSPPR